MLRDEIEDPFGAEEGVGGQRRHGEVQQRPVRVDDQEVHLRGRQRHDQILLRKVDVRLPRKGNSNSHGARPVRLITTMV